MTIKSAGERRFRVDPETRRPRPDVLWGGSPPRFLRLSQQGVAGWEEIAEGAVDSPAARTLAERLVAVGAVHPVCDPIPTHELAGKVHIVVPVKDRSWSLAALLRSLDRYLPNVPVTVVDDGSGDPAAIAAAAQPHATVIRRPVAGGPGVARNAGLATVDTPFVVFIDSDCRGPVDTPWIETLVAHLLADPGLAAIAPKVVGVETSPSALLPTTASPVDMGGAPGLVGPGRRVPYVPTATVVARVEALRSIVDGGPSTGEGETDGAQGTDGAESDNGAAVFDPALRYGEDVDALWRVIAAGWRVRYEPSVVVCHDEPSTVTARLARRFRYGTSAAPLGIRHGKAVAPVQVEAWPTLSLVAAVAGRPLIMVGAYGAAVMAIRRKILAAAMPADGVAPAVAKGFVHSWRMSSRYVQQLWWPLAIVSACLPGISIGLRARIVALVCGHAATRGSRDAQRSPVRKAVDAFRSTGAEIVENAAYGAGVWAGAWRWRYPSAVLPRRTGPTLLVDEDQRGARGI